MTARSGKELLQVLTKMKEKGQVFKIDAGRQELNPEENKEVELNPMYILGVISMALTFLVEPAYFEDFYKLIDTLPDHYQIKKLLGGPLKEAAPSLKLLLNQSSSPTEKIRASRHLDSLGLPHIQYSNWQFIWDVE